MKVLFINSVCGIRSTGRIVTDLAEDFIRQGHECIIAYGRESVPVKYKDISYRIGTETDVKINALKARVFDNEGFNAKRQTEKFIDWANNYNPDLLWLHNLHGYYINIELLFNWIKSRPHMQVRWTLHDCWSFTGHCAHFSYVKCNKWKTNCNHCKQKKCYPSTFFLDSSTLNYKKKRTVFCGVKNLTIITPTFWLAKLVKLSFLNEYPIRVQYNSIDTNVFKPTQSDFRSKYNLENKIIVLGVATTWNDRKGLYEFIEISEKLAPNFQVVLVGLKKKQISCTEDRILCIPQTNSKEELAGIYSAADIFLNLSKEETFGLTTLEALSCGAYPIVYKDTACEEVVKKYGGLAVEQNLSNVFRAINDFVADN